MPGSRILALDYGTKRIGVALSDELRWTAQPLETFERRTLDRDLAHIASLVDAHEVGRVVLGFPLQLDGKEGPAIQAMRDFAGRLEQRLAVPLVLWDERMTTKAAEDLLIAADVSRKKRKGAVDRVAAALLLQSYLASLESPPAGRTGTDPVSDDWAYAHTVRVLVEEGRFERLAWTWVPMRTNAAIGWVAGKLVDTSFETLRFTSACFGALGCLAQTDMKRLLAYSSIENMGLLFVGVGLTLVFFGYDLSLNRYKEVVHEAVGHRPPKEILAELAKLEEEIQRGMKELEGMLQ